MKKKQLALSFIPIFGSVSYMIIIFLESISTKNKKNWSKAVLSFAIGMIVFIPLYYALLIGFNSLEIDFNKYMWILYILIYFLFVIWNIVFFLVYNKLTKKANKD